MRDYLSLYNQFEKSDLKQDEVEFYVQYIFFLKVYLEIC